ncbi:hypothetical protein [Acaryochloris sp. IP29b_bin.148]|uniref:tetratricopeptide repeat protein n=1 Tax=Acaryochloris sp. IP29b_bin.148 TaxID=2969218 RepID=UPI00261A06D9|nr:hypothetical protein [Acaryochloris sp. IP29b_bin.148]
MHQDITIALERQDYEIASQLIKAVPDNDPWGQLYLGQLQAAQSNYEQAESTFRSLLQQDYGPKIAQAARQGLKQIQDHAQAVRQEKLSQATATPEQTQTGALILEALPSDAKTKAALEFAKIMQVEPYTARMLIPSRGWRLYRVGPIGELAMYGQDLQAAGIPNFSVTLAQVQQLKVHQVCYFQTLQPSPEVIVSDHHAQQTGSFRFNWSEVTQRVEGLVPIFEEVVDRDPRGKLKRKEKTQDHAQFCDLHLPQKGCILRFYDAAYQFNQGVPLTEVDRETSWANWRGLTTLLTQNLPHATTWADFTSFAETAVEQLELLGAFESYINLLRREDSKWDQAFHLYSSLAMLKP